MLPLLHALPRPPAQVLPFISGILIDVYGIPRMVLVLITLATLGQLVFTGGALFMVRVLRMLLRGGRRGGCGGGPDAAVAA